MNPDDVSDLMIRLDGLISLLKSANKEDEAETTKEAAYLIMALCEIYFRDKVNEMNPNTILIH